MMNPNELIFRSHSLYSLLFPPLYKMFPWVDPRFEVRGGADGLLRVAHLDLKSGKGAS